jgi:hypothetical protein
MCQEKLGAKS